MRRSKTYYCLVCSKRLTRRKRKFCSNSCKCKFFYKNHPDKCNTWNKNNPKPKVDKNCLICGNPSGRKKYCSEKCKPKMIIIKPYWKGMARFNSICYTCLKTYSILHIHHRDGNHNNNLPENLIGLCPSCHQLVYTPKFYPNIKTDKERKISLLRKEIDSLLKIS